MAVPKWTSVYRQAESTVGVDGAGPWPATLDPRAASAHARALDGTGRPAPGLIRTNVSMSTSTKFWDRIAERYSKQPIADEQAYQKKLAVTREYLRPEMQVLEFGCGTGSTAIAHAPYVKHIHASDISSKMIAIAKQKASAAGVENVTFEQASLDALDVADGTLDVVLGLSVLHLLDDKDAAIAKVYKMLRPGGVFVSSTACLGDSQNYFKLILPIGRVLGLLPMVRFFTTSALEESLESVGFEIDYRYQPGKGKAVFIVAKKAHEAE